MWNLGLKKQFPIFKVIAAPFVLRANAQHCPKFTLIKDTLHHVSIPASPGLREISFMFSFRPLWWSKSKFLLKPLCLWGNAGVMAFINIIFFHFQNYKRSRPDQPQEISEWVSGVTASLQSGKTSHIHHFQVTSVVCSYWNMFRGSKFQQISCPSCFQLSGSSYSQLSVLFIASELLSRSILGLCWVGEKGEGETQAFKCTSLLWETTKQHLNITLYTLRILRAVTSVAFYSALCSCNTKKWIFRRSRSWCWFDPPRDVFSWQQER